jgi:hypothetical protein
VSAPDFKDYLGDGVYVRLDLAAGVWLTTEDGISETNAILLEPDVLENFVRWLNARGIRAIEPEYVR